MDTSEAWQKLDGAVAGVLGTVDAERGTHLVPVVFTRCEAARIVISVDAKPKRTRRLRRLANIERDPRVTLLVDHYESDWRRLWWVRVDGHALVRDRVEAGVTEQHRERHPQLVDHVLGPWIDIEIDAITGWSAN